MCQVSNLLSVYSMHDMGSVQVATAARTLAPLPVCCRQLAAAGTLLHIGEASLNKPC